MKHETGTRSFLDRQSLAVRFEENLSEFMKDHGFSVFPYGHPIVLQDSSWLRSRLKKVDSKGSLASIRMKFTPDYILIHEEKGIFIYMDAKASITPVFFQSQIDRIQFHYGNREKLLRNDIGEIEREAWLTYNKFYPSNQIAIIIASPYNKNLLLAEWVENIECMWCLKTAEEGNPIPWNCKKCPLETDGEGFGVLVNEFAGGSGTPHTNLDFKSFRTLKNFMNQEFSIDVQEDSYEILTDFIKEWDLNKPPRVNWTQFNNVVRKLRQECPWLKCRIKDTYIPCRDDEPTLFQAF